MTISQSRSGYGSQLNSKRGIVNENSSLVKNTTVNTFSINEDTHVVFVHTLNSHPLRLWFLKRAFSFSDIIRVEVHQDPYWHKRKVNSH